MRPITLWLVGIAALVVVLVVGGGFRRPVVFVVLIVLAVALVAGFAVFSRAAKRHDAAGKTRETPPHDGPRA